MEVTYRRPGGAGVGSWSSSRRGTVAIAAVVALVAAGIFVYALHRYKQSVGTANQPATVLVASRLIEQGTSGAAIGVGRYFTLAHLNAKQVSQGALSNTAALHGMVAARDIYPGQQLTSADFVYGGLFESRLPANERAISVPLDTSHGMIGYIHTGDRVDVYVSFSKTGTSNTPNLHLLANNVVVLDAGQLPTAGAIGGGISSTTSTANVVLEVGNRDAADLAFAADYGKIWLVLAPPNGTSASSQSVTEESIVAETRKHSGGGQP